MILLQSKEMSIIFFSTNEKTESQCQWPTQKNIQLSGTSGNLNLQEMSEFLEESGSNRIKYKLLELTMEKNEQQSEEQWVKVQEIFWMEENEVDSIIATDAPNVFSK